MNRKILLREMCNDVIGISLKYLSLISATSGQGALRAEFYRTTLDGLNHFFLSIANLMNNKSMQGLKRVILFIPAFLFIGIGLSTLQDFIIQLKSG